MIKDEYKSLIKSVHTLQKSVDELRARWDDESKDVTELTIRVGKVEAVLEGVTDALHVQKKEIKAAVTETIQEEMEPVQKSMDKLSTKEVLYQKIKGRKWLFFKRKEG